MNDTTNNPKCQHCSTEMEYGKHVDKNMTLQVLGILIFIIGLCALVVVPIGTIIGLVLMIIAARLGYSKKAGWKCPNCKYFYEAK